MTDRAGNKNMIVKARIKRSGSTGHCEGARKGDRYYPALWEILVDGTVVALWGSGHDLMHPETFRMVGRRTPFDLKDAKKLALEMVENS